MAAYAASRRGCHPCSWRCFATIWSQVGHRNLLQRLLRHASPQRTDTGGEPVRLGSLLISTEAYGVGGAQESARDGVVGEAPSSAAGGSPEATVSCMPHASADA